MSVERTPQAGEVWIDHVYYGDDSDNLDRNATVVRVRGGRVAYSFLAWKDITLSEIPLDQFVIDFTPPALPAELLDRMGTALGALLAVLPEYLDESACLVRMRKDGARWCQVHDEAMMGNESRCYGGVHADALAVLREWEARS